MNPRPRTGKSRNAPCTSTGLHLRGWCHHPAQPIVRVEALINNTLPYPLASYGLESPDIAVTFGPAANHMRFDD